MKQGEIWYADLNPVKGSEQSGFRPVVIVSGNLLNKYLKTVIAIPLTTKVKGYKGNPILSPSPKNGLNAYSEMLIFHTRSISKVRLVKKIGGVEKKHVDLAKKTLQDILTY